MEVPHAGIFPKVAAEAAEKGADGKGKGDGQIGRRFDNKTADEPGCEAYGKIKLQCLREEAEVCKAETVVQRLVEENVRAEAAVKLVPADPLAPVLLPLYQPCAFLACAGSVQHLRLFGGPGECFLIEIRADVPGEPGKKRAAREHCGKAQNGRDRIFLCGKHDKALDPAPKRDETGDRCIEIAEHRLPGTEPARLHEEVKAACDEAEPEIDEAPQVLLKARMDGAEYKAEHFQQLRDPDGQDDAESKCEQDPEGKTAVFHQIRDLVDHHVEREDDRSPDLRHGAEKQDGLRFHR